jgi:hypothetical protein
LRFDSYGFALDRCSNLGCVLNNVAYSKNCHNGSFEIMRCPSKKAPCGSMPCWFIYTPHHLYSILYIKVTIRGTLPKFDLQQGFLSIFKSNFCAILLNCFWNPHNPATIWFNSSFIIRLVVIPPWKGSIVI